MVVVTLPILVALSVAGITLGALYAVMSMGVTIVWGTVRVLNFAHGALLTAGAYVVWSVLSFGGASAYTLAFLIMMPILFLVGIGVNKLIIKPLRRWPTWGMTHFIATLGASIFIVNFLQLIYGPAWEQLPPMIGGQLRLGGYAVTYQQLLNVVIAVTALVAIAVFLQVTRPGLAMRAVSEDAEAAGLVGINVERIYTITLGIGTLLAGVAGGLVAIIFTLTPVMGTQPFLKAFIIIVFGGLGSVKGTIVAAFLVGVIESFVGYFLGLFWTQPVLFGIMIAVLLLRPTGLFGVKEAVV